MARALALIGLISACSAAVTQPASDHQLFEKAVAAFREGVALAKQPAKAQVQFRVAAVCYEALRGRGFVSATLYRNQGNAYLLAGELPRAILAYRRGLRLSPGDESLQLHLERARGHVARDGAGEFGRPPDVGVRFYLSPAALMILGVLFYSGCWLALTAWWMSRRALLLGVAAVAGALSAAAFDHLVVERRHRLDDANHPLIVVAKDQVELRSGNGKAYPPRYDSKLRRGVEARCLYERPGWLQIELTGGQVGWIPRDAASLDAS
jgi:tetratricopeptide (TPR) repeat protein